MGRRPEFHAVLDPFTLMAVAAAVTERVQIGTNALNASVVHAKELAERILGLARRPAQ